MRMLATLTLALAFAAPTMAAEKTIVETAAGNDSFETLVAAVKAADLVETLNSEGPFTVFAPTDKAFAKLGEETLQELLKPENKEKLTKILTYHVVPGKVTASQVVKLDGEKVKTAAGPQAMISVDGNTVKVDEAKVIKTDIMCSNGVIHVIDSVIVPSEE